MECRLTTKNGEVVDLKLHVHLNKMCKENRQYMRGLTDPLAMVC